MRTDSLAPLSNSLGILATEGGDAFVLQPSGAARVVGACQVDRGAIIALVDHGLGSHLRRRLGGKVALATLNLRIDWMETVRPDRSVTVRPVIMAQDTLGAVITADILQDGEAWPLGRAVAWMMVGAAPGGSDAVLESEPLNLYSPEDSASFRDLVAIQESGETFFVPANPRLVGNAAVSALHGGIIAAALDEVAHRIVGPWAGSGTPSRALGMTIDYLRPALVSAGDLTLKGSVKRRGRTLCSVDVEAWSGRSPALAAKATVKFVQDLGEIERAAAA